MAETLGVTDMLANTYEPLKKNRWVFAIEGIDLFFLKTAARPKMNVEPITIDWINDKRYVAGKHEFDVLSVTLYSGIAPSASQQVMEWIRLCHEAVSGRGGYADFYKRSVQLKMLDPFGTVVELWDGKGCWVTEANFGDLDYASGEVADITLSIRADKWILQY